MSAAEFRPDFERVCGLAVGPIGIAVSGGSDSIAMLCMAAEWAQTANRDVIALTVDHGLRAEAADEARWVAGQAQRLGITHQTLTWDKPIGRQAAARRARHVLLAQAILAAGGECILLGHTFDDQIETVLMRQRQQSTWYGLAGMQRCATSPVWPEGQGVFVGRPLLAARREDLRTWLKARNQAWIDDPSNEKEEYERVRVRSELSKDAALFAEISAIQAKASQERVVEDRALGHFIQNHVVIENSGRITVQLDELTDERKMRVLSILLQIVSGKELPPRLNKLNSLVEALGAGPTFAGATLHGVIVKQIKGTTLLQPERHPLQYGSILGRLLMMTKQLTGSLC